MTDKNNNNSAVGFIRKNMSGFVAGSVLTCLVMLLIGQGKISEFSITGGKDGSFGFALKKENTPFSELVDTLWAQKPARVWLIDFMSKKGYRGARDANFTDLVKNMNPKDKNSILLLEMARNGEYGPWLNEADTGEISYPGQRSAPKGNIVNTWRGSTLDGKTITLSSWDHTENYEFVVKDKLSRKPAGDSKPKLFFHISDSMARILLGNKSGRGKVWVSR